MQLAILHLRDFTLHKSPYSLVCGYEQVCTASIFHQIPVSSVPFAIIFMLLLIQNVFAPPHINSNPIKILDILFNSMIVRQQILQITLEKMLKISNLYIIMYLTIGDKLIH